MLNMDEKRINMADFAISAAKQLFQRHCKKSTKNENTGIFRVIRGHKKVLPDSNNFRALKQYFRHGRRHEPRFCCKLKKGVLSMLNQICS